MIRHFSLFGATFTENGIEIAKGMVTGFLGRQKTIEILSTKFRDFVKSSY